MTTGLLFTVIASYDKRSMFARLRTDCRIAKMRREKPQRSVAVLNVKETQKNQEDAQLSVCKGPTGRRGRFRLKNLPRPAGRQNGNPQADCFLPNGSRKNKFPIAVVS